MTAIIETQGLTKNYGSSRGIRDVSLSVTEGEVFGFLGPNGAGKTTTIRLLMGLLRATSGSASIGGLDCWNQSTEVKKLIGYLPSEFSLDPVLTGGQIIEYLGNLRGGIDKDYVKKLVQRLDLDLSKRFRAYSRGNKQKVGLVQAFMHRPRLLILDEPTGGLDPLNQQEFYEMVKEVREAGSTVFLSSHILPEVEQICSRVGIIRDGQLIRVDQVSALRDLKHHIVEVSFTEQASPDWFKGLAGVQSVDSEQDGHQVKLTVQGDLRDILKIAAQHDATNIVSHEPSLEEIFLRYYEGDGQAAKEASHVV